MALENMANERDSCKSLAQELQERIKVSKVLCLPYKEAHLHVAGRLNRSHAFAGLR